MAEQTTVQGSLVTRRNFLLLGWGGLLAFVGSSFAATARFLFPNVIYEPSQKFNAGKAQRFPDGVTVIREQRVMVVREGSKVYALWQRCTHLGCTPNWFQAESRIRCPCHGSNFSQAGDVIAGPAPKPLFRCAVQLTPAGDLIVDKAVLANRPGMRDRAPYVVEV